MAVFILFIFGVATAGIASSRGRSLFAWFLLGFFFHFLALIALLVLPNLDDERNRERAMQAKTNRLQEQLAQERMKNQSFRGHVNARLDVHDEALELDTRGDGTPALLPPPTPPAPAPVAGLAEDGWYVAMPGEEAEGPLALTTLMDRINQGDINQRTLVWHAEGEAEWLPLRDTQLRTLLS